MEWDAGERSKGKTMSFRSSRRSWAVLVAFAVFALMAASSGAYAAPSRWGDITGPVTATSMGVRIPTTLAEVATLTPADEARMNAAVVIRWPDVQRLIEQGALAAQSRTSRAPFTLRRIPGTLPAVQPTHFYSDAQCGVFWTDIPASGTWVWGGGWTRSNTSTFIELYNGHFYKDGSYLSAFGASLTGTNAESYSAHDWRYWWENQHTYFTESDHRIWNGGSLDWGPAHCTITQYK